MAELNAVAFIREDSQIVEVIFNESNSRANPPVYQYLTNLDLAIGDTCVVLVGGSLPKCVSVVGRKDISELPPNYEHQLRWIACKVDFTDYDNLMKENAEIEQLIAKAYQTSVRNTFKQQILGMLPEEDRMKLAHFGEKK